MDRSQPQPRSFPGDWELSRQNRAFIVLLVDQSVGAASAAISERANDTIFDACNSLSLPEGFKDYVDLSVIGYHTSSKGVPVVGPILSGPLSDREYVAIRDLADNPLRTETTHALWSDENDQPIALPVNKPVWIESIASGGAPLGAALLRATLLVDAWLSRSSTSIPPLVINLTSGLFEGPPLSPFASRLQSRATSLGNVLLCHDVQIRDVCWSPRLLDTTACIPQLFDSASEVPQSLREVLFLWKGMKLEHGSKLFFLNSTRPFASTYLTALDTGDRAFPSLSQEDREHLASLKDHA